MQFFYGTKIDFVGKRQIFFIVSSIIIIGGLIATFGLGVKYGIDFEGGTELVVKVSDDVNTGDIRDVVESTGITGSEVKSYGKTNQYSIRVKASMEDKEKVKNALIEKFSLTNEAFDQEKSIGPKVGGEMKQDAFIAVFLAILAILMYIAFRFEFVYGLGAIVALAHDVIVTFSFLVIFHHAGIMNLEMNITILAGLLTVVGFSINDTVIIFDRVRENLERHKGMPFTKLVNMSINETMTRTVNTVLTVVLVLATMVALGGPVIEGFALTMLIGILTGTYSSVYIASSFVIWFLEKVKKVDVDGNSKKEAVKTA